MTALSFARRMVPWVAVLTVGLLIGTLLVGRGDAAQPGPPGGLEVSEQNLDSNGNIKVAEQGVAEVVVTGGSLDAVVDFPEEQDVNVTNASLAAAQSGDWNVGITGTPTVNVGSLPSTGSPLRGSTGFFDIDPGDPRVVLSVPSDVVVTDITGDFVSVNDDDACTLIVGDGPGFYRSVFGNERYSLNLTTGVQGPFSISVNRGGAPDSECRGTLFWTGVSTS